MEEDPIFMREALRLARRGYGATSPNPMVGAVLVRGGKIIGRGWHHRAGGPHAEIEALQDAEKHAGKVRGATLYVSLEPCSTQGRTPPCTEAIVRVGIARVVVGATDPNPKHQGRGLRMLEQAGVRVLSGLLAKECTELNEAFNHWIVHRTPWVTVKAAMTLDGKIATATGESKWITGEKARQEGMRLRLGVDAILAGINTVLLDDPSLSYRAPGKDRGEKRLWRIILDSHARTPLSAKVLQATTNQPTMIVVSPEAPEKRVRALRRIAEVIKCPHQAARRKALDLGWLLKHLGKRDITSLLVEGGGEVNASFLLGRLAYRVVFFYAPKILGGRDARRGVAGEGAARLSEVLNLSDLGWKRLGPDWMLRARVVR